VERQASRDAAALALDAGSLEASLQRHLGAGGLGPSRSRVVLGYLASLAAETGSEPAQSLLDRLADGPDSGGPPALPAQLDSVWLAAHVKVRADQCLRHGDPCNDVNAAVAALVGRRQADGSWAAAPFAGDGDGEAAYFTGSAPETTSVALKALASYARVLDGRASGALVWEEGSDRPRRRPPTPSTGPAGELPRR